MSRATVTIDLDEFDDEDILERAREIAARRGIADLSTVDADLVAAVADLAHCIHAGDAEAAFYHLDLIVQQSATLRQAVEVGRRRVR